MNWSRIISAVLACVLSSACLSAQISLSGGEAQEGNNAQAGEDTSTDKPRKCAWSLSEPLGLRFDSTIDTLMLNYQRQAIPSLVSDAYASVGNLGTEGQNQIYFARPRQSTFFFRDALMAWIPTFENRRLYNVFTPMTLASYNFGGNRDSGQDRLRADFAGNVNRRIGIGAFADYLYSKGSYANQAAKDLAYGFSGYYTGDRYEAQAFFYQYNFLNKENGGITDDRYITDPAELQGGVSKIESKSIPTMLSNAHTRLRGTEFYMSHAYNVGYWREVQVNDTLTREVYVPVTKFIYSLDYRKGVHIFRNTDMAQGDEMWGARRYLNAEATADETRYWQLSNTLGVSMIEGFRRWAKFGLAAYVTYETRHFTQANNGWTPPEDSGDGETAATTALTPLPDGVAVKPTDSQNLLWVGGQLTKQRGAVLHYDADARFGLIGDVAGDIEINGNISTDIRMLGDTVNISAHGHFRNLDNPYLLKHFISNHYAWDNDLGKTRSIRAEGALFIPWSNTRISAGWESVQNHVYFNTAGLPSQHGGTVHVFSASLTQKLRLGIWNWDNTLTYQTSSNQEVLPLPALSVYSNMYLHFRAFRVLQLQIGVDCDYYTRYRGVNYDPATMAFRVGDDWKVGNFPFCNAYVTAKLYRVRFFILYSHLNQGWFTKEYFSMPHYPVNPRRLQFGLSVDFAN